MTSVFTHLIRDNSYYFANFSTVTIDWEGNVDLLVAISMK